MRLENIRVSIKLACSLGGLMALMLLVALASQFQAARTAQTNLTMVAAYEQRIAQALEWKGAIERVGESVLASNVTPDANLTALFDGRVQQGIAGISVMQGKIERSADSADDHTTLERAQTERSAVQALNKRLRSLKQTSDAETTARFIESEYLPGIARYTTALEEFVQLQRTQRDAALEQAATAQRQASVLGWLLQGGVFVIGLFVAVWLTRSITRPLQQALALSQTIASGDLTARTHTARQDEFGQLLQAQATMADRLHQLVSDVRGSVQSITTAAQEIASGNQDLSARTEQTAASLEESAASMEELTTTVAQSADTAVQANQLVHSAVQAAEHGVQVVGQVIHSMERITNSSQRISDIIGVIDGIAFQTNILALNAAVEAARAGEQGRGFAVVAGEVRTLAQRSAEAAKEIKQLITASVEAVQTGSDQVSQAGKAMSGVESGVRRVTDLISEISAAAGEQRDGIAQVNQVVNQLDQMTQQNAALVEESAAAASALHGQTQYLTELVAFFKLEMSGQAARPAAVAPVRAQPTATPRTATTAASLRAAPAVARPQPAAKALPSSDHVLRSPAKPAAPATEDDWESF